MWNFCVHVPLRRDDRSETLFKTFCILIRSQTLVSNRLKFETLVSAKDEVPIISACVYNGRITDLCQQLFTLQVEQTAHEQLHNTPQH